MGKYMRKAKVTGDVAVMEVSQSFLGVRTRAKTLALQRLQSSAVVPSPPSPSEDSCYLELRSRRLMKPLQQQNSRKAGQTCGCSGKEDPETRNSKEFLRTGMISGSTEAQNLGIEACFRENNLDCQAWERSTPESTPCSLIKGSDTIPTPVSTTKRTCSSTAAIQRTRAVKNVPTTRELEEIFAREEQSQQLLFMEKYNFDIVKELPLPGRYEWVKVRS